MVNSRSKLVQPQEIEVWYTIPAIRKALAIELKSINIGQKEIASLLNITEAAVSHYLQNKRAGEVLMPKSLKSKVHESALKLLKRESAALIEINKLSMTNEVQMIKCKLHRQYNPSLKTCTICKICGKVK